MRQVFSNIDQHLKAMDFSLSTELSAPRGSEQTGSALPFYFFANAMQSMMYGGVTVGDKPASYNSQVLISGIGSGVE